MSSVNLPGSPARTGRICAESYFRLLGDEGRPCRTTFKRCRPHRRKNLGLELEVLQESISTQQMQFRRGRKACGHRGNLCFLNYGQLLPEKFRAFVLGRELFYHRCHHRVSPKKRRWRTSGPTLRCLNTSDVTYGRKKGPCCH